MGTDAFHFKFTIYIFVFCFEGYPRSMRDTSEYYELFGRVDAVILINWHLYTLERQIHNGAKVKC